MDKEPNVLRLWCPRCDDMEYVLVHLVDTVKFSFTCLTCHEYTEVRSPAKYPIVKNQQPV